MQDFGTDPKGLFSLQWDQSQLQPVQNIGMVPRKNVQTQSQCGSEPNGSYLKAWVQTQRSWYHIPKGQFAI